MRKIFKQSINAPNNTQVAPGTPKTTENKNEYPLSSSVFGGTVEQKEEEIKKMIRSNSQLFTKMTTLQNEKNKLESLKNQSQSIFINSQSNCAVYNFVPKLLRGTPCDFVAESNFSSGLTQNNVSLQEVQKNYKNFIDILTQLIQSYNNMHILMDEVREFLDKQTTNEPKLNQPASSLIDAAKAAYNTDRVTLINEKTDVTLKNDALFDNSMGKSILDCYEEIIDINEILCERVYQPLQKSFATLGMGPVTVYVKQLITGYQDIMRIYTQELAPIYQNIAQKTQNINQKRVQYTLNMLSKIIPQSYRVKIIELETGLFDVATQNNPTRLQNALEGGFSNTKR